MYWYIVLLAFCEYTADKYKNENVVFDDVSAITASVYYDKAREDKDKLLDNRSLNTLYKYTKNIPIAHPLTRYKYDSNYNRREFLKGIMNHPNADNDLRNSIAHDLGIE